MSKDKPTGGDQRHEPPQAILDFAEKVIQGSLMRFDVLRFFHENPYAILTISDLSVWMSREERPLAEALQQLASLGYLTQSPASSAFVLTSDREKRRRLEELFDFLEQNPDAAKEMRARLRGRGEAD